MLNNLKHVSILVVLAILLTAGGFVTGRFLTPPKTVTVEKTKIEYVEKQVVVERVVTKIQIVKVTEKANNIATDKHIVKTKDGTVTIDEHVRDTSQEKTGTNINTTTDANKATTTDKKETVETSRVTTTDGRPNWSLSLQPGFDIAGALGHGDPYSIFPGAINGVPLHHLMLGVAVDHRLIGPLFTGVWANSAGAGGLILRMEF